LADFGFNESNLVMVSTPEELSSMIEELKTEKRVVYNKKDRH
jgi:hypothetical protein